MRYNEWQATAETSGTGEPWVYRPVVGGRSTLLVTRSRCATRRGNRFIPPSPCSGVLGQKGTCLAMDSRELLP